MSAVDLRKGYTFVQITLNRADGLHILTKATLQQLLDDEALRLFADGLIPQAFVETDISTIAQWTVAEALYHDGLPQINALVTILLALDTEVNAVVNDENRVWPLPGYLSYRSHLPLDKYPLNSLRLPPLNADGHYRFAVIDESHYLAVRLDIHPKLKVVGHIRIAISGPTRSPERITGAEHRLDRQELTEEVIKAAIIAGSEALTTALTQRERVALIEVLMEFV